jgi:ADP-dependent phosphofructokinase/glucokinase
MPATAASQIRTLILRAKSSDAIAPKWLSELEQIASQLEHNPLKSEPLRFALSALLQSVKRGASANWYVTDAELFVWAMDELDKLTEA